MKKFFIKTFQLLWQFVLAIIITVFATGITNEIMKGDALHTIWLFIRDHLNIIIFISGISLAFIRLMYQLIKIGITRSVEKKFNSLADILKKHFDTGMENTEKTIEYNSNKINQILQFNQDINFPISVTSIMLMREIILPKIFTRQELKEAISKYPYFYLDGLQMCGFDNELCQIAKISKLKLDNENTTDNINNQIEMEKKKLKDLEMLYSINDKTKP